MLPFSRQESLQLRRHPRPLNEFLSRSSRETGIQQRLEEHAQLLQRVRSLLPPPLDHHCLAAVLKDERLLLYTDTSAWASRMRFHSRELTRDLIAKHVPIKKISIRVMIQPADRPRKARGMRRLSSENAALIRETADDLSDPGLKAALQRLADKTR